MKIALTTYGDSLEAKLDSSFGRAKQFMIYDLETDTFQMKDNNQNLNAVQGAGIQAAQNVAEAGAEAVITGHCGPKAFLVLTTAKIEVYNTKAVTVKEAIEKFKKGELTKADAADVDAHWV
ncbi:MAG: NifB/NifX family molybdenum-iron cluster-binding protein [Candidatus Cloacimonetes bacterium]|nr:NifB/NifX family molybdenum-iron cluster-binding protein [Candidatus Cloacimonadota bacterium]